MGPQGAGEALLEAWCTMELRFAGPGNPMVVSATKLGLEVGDVILESTTSIVYITRRNSSDLKRKFRGM